MSDIETVSSGSNGAQEFDFDPDTLRTKYREERDKRIRTDGNEQYVEVKGDFSRYIDDPYVDPGFTRAPLNDAVEVVIIGGGFGGLLAGARLREAGVKNIRMIEKGGDFGGTWYWNRYPGAQCDIESYIYLPLLEETGYIPKEKYSFAPEILAHARRIGEKFDLYRDACFQTPIKEITWSEDECRWIVTTDRGDSMRARFVVMSNGPLNRPKLPGIPGIESYKGHTFHTSRWDYGYTGGDTNGNLHKLADKRVAIIGTGATAVQCVPHLGKAREASVCLPAHAVVGRRARQPADRSRVGEDVEAGMAEASHGKLQHAGVRPARGSRPRQRRMDRHHPQPRRPAHEKEPGLGDIDGRDRTPGGNRGLQEDEPDPRARRRARQGQAHRRGAEALVSPVLQAPHFQ